MTALAAQAVMLFHFLFVAFVVAGSLLVLRWPRLVYTHIAAFIWGMLVVVNQWVCPLTPLEQNLRLEAGIETFQGGFISHYIEPLLYPDGLSRSTKLVFGSILLVINLLIWTAAWRKLRRRRIPAGKSADNPTEKKQADLNEST